MATISFSGGSKLESVLDGIAKRAGHARELKVGFMEGATYPDGTSVAMVAAIQNFGAPAVNIPARPFFSNMVREKSPRWGQSLGNLLKASDYDSQTAMESMGLGIAGQLQQSIQDTNSPKLADSTIAAKGFSKPLIETGHMQNSVDYDVDGQTFKGPTA